jgi:hypothetical protein
MAQSALRKKGLARNKKTGRTYRVNVKRSRAAKKGARKRLHKHLKPQTKRKIAMGLKKAIRSKRTKGGRRSLRKVATHKNKAPRKRRAHAGTSAENFASAVSTYRDHR